MGVPKFAAWLTKKYPSMVGTACPSDVHGLYVDLNGLIHPCCHDEHDPTVALRPESEKLRQICLAVETLVVTCKPQKVLYIAIDGVAPRAKMNQQRARRYMSAAEPMSGADDAVAAIEREFTDAERKKAEEELEEVGKALQSDALYGGAPLPTKDTPSASPTSSAQLLQSELPATDALLFEDAGRPPAVAAAFVAVRRKPAQPDDDSEEDRFDSNCISPGTAFMAKVADAMRVYVEAKLIANDPLWAPLTVVFSDSSTPGEGEHKLIDFLRTQSSHPGFNGHGAHVIAGLDADLIFLALSLHIPRVVILRDNKRPSSFDRAAAPPRTVIAAPQPIVDDEEEDSAAAEEETGAETSTAVTPSLHPAPPPTNLGATDGGDDDDDDVAEEAEEVVVPAISPCMTYEYYDVDVVGSSLVSEVYQLCRVKGFHVAPGAFSEDSTAWVTTNGYDFSRAAGKPGGEHKPTRGGARGFPHPCTSTCNSKIIDDFIVLSMLVGNDFLPRVPSGFAGESAIDNIIEMYVGEVLPHGYLTAGNHRIDLRQLQRLCAAYEKIEAVKFRQYCVQNNLMTAQEAALPLRSAKDVKTWREPYLRSTGLNAPEELEKACRAFVEGLCFVWSYYSRTSGEINWDWYYPFHHAPLAMDLADFLAAQCQEEETMNAIHHAASHVTDSPDVFAQLLCILPPTSQRILPQVFWSTMSTPPAALGDTFPRRWLVDYTAAYGKEHLAAVMLPFANMALLRALVQEKASELSTDEVARRKSTRYHLVLSRCSASDESGTETSAAGAGEDRRFRIQGDGLTDILPPEAGECAGSTVPWSMRAGVSYARLCDTVPELCRPRTYSYTVPIPNLSLDASGRLVRPERRPYRGGNSSRWKGKASPAEFASAAAAGGGGAKWGGSAGGPAGRRGGKNGAGGANADGGAEQTGAAVAPTRTYLAEFMVCAAVIALFATACLQAAMTRFSFPSLFFLSRWKGVMVVQLQVVAVFAAAIVLSYALGLATNGGKKSAGSGIHRNSTRLSFVDWQCQRCLSLNFSRNVRCFICEAPFNPYRSWALFSGKVPPSPPLMEPDHRPNMVQFGFSE